MKAVALFLLLAASPALGASCPSHGMPMARTELLFGAGHVSAAQWQSFLAGEVTPRFPEVLTALDGYGQWKSPDGRIVAEPSRILILWHRTGAEANGRIDAIRNAYKKRFHQLSVMRVDSADCVTF